MRSLVIAAENIGYRFHPSPGRHALIAAQPGRVSEVLRRITGPRLTALTLGAPPPGSVAPGWHEVEQSAAGPFRWTASSRVVWRAPEASDNLEIRIPCQDMISPNFLKECAVLVDGREAEVTVTGSDLTACVSGLPPLTEVNIELRTPEPKTPRSIRGFPDDRPLGLAVAVI